MLILKMDLSLPICLLISLFSEIGFPSKVALHYQDIEPYYSESEDRYLRTIKMSTEGFKPGMLVALTCTKIDGSTVPYELKRIGEKGVLLNSVMHFDKFFKGEPITYTIETVDGKQRASVKIVPYPIEVTDSKGHRISLEHIDADGMFFQLKLEGFKPFEVVHGCSISAHEKLEFNLKTKKDGTITSLYSPAVIGKESGTASLEITGKETENLIIEYEWGSLRNKPWNSATARSIDEPECPPSTNLSQLTTDV